MPHVITQSCCSDGSCVYACPVNCIHPSPDEPGFATAEMLYIDPVACVDCGACVSRVPGRRDRARHPAGTDEQLPFVELNAAFYPQAPTAKLPPTSKLAPVIEAPMVQPRAGRSVDGGDRRLRARRDVRRRRTAHPAWRAGQRLRKAADALRSGARRGRARSPEHQAGDEAVRQDDRRPGFTFYLNVEVGSDLTHADLLAHHHAVLYAVGAPNDRRLDIDGMGLPGTGTATEMVAWINGHPEFTDLPVDLSHERVVDRRQRQRGARRRADPDHRSGCAGAHRHLRPRAGRAAAVRRCTEVVIAARRGPAQSAFTLPELIGLTSTCDVVLDAADHELVRPRPRRLA